MAKSTNLKQAVSPLVEIGRLFYKRGWVPGTSGNFSVLLEQNPFRAAVTPSGLPKGELAVEQFVEVGSDGIPIHSEGAKPSDETLLHIAIMQAIGAQSVLHTHSVWNSLISDLYLKKKGLTLEGYEMLKGLEGVKTHDHQEWIPVLENSQKMKTLALEVETMLRKNSKIHGFLLHKHGLYAWGKSVAEAKRHVEVFEFLLEIHGRMQRLRRS